jgi:hypothetical protein
MAQNLFATLKQYDIEFLIGPEMLKNIFEYMVSFRNEVYFKCFRDKIFMQVRSSDNTQYSDITISKDGVQEYNANIPEDIESRYEKLTNEEKVRYRNISVTGEGAHKRVLLNMIDKNPTTPLQELTNFMGKGLIRVRIDTLVEKKIEFIMQRGLYVWLRLMDPNSEEAKMVENMPNVINKIRNNPDVSKAVMTMEPGLFKKLVFLGGKPSKESNSHTRAMIRVDDSHGMIAASGDTMRGRILKLGVLGDSSSYNETSDEDNKKEDNEFLDGEKESEDNYEDTDEFVPTVDIKEDMFAEEKEEIQFLTASDIYKPKDKKKDKVIDFSTSTSKEDKKKKKSKKEEEIIMDDAVSNDLSSVEVEMPQSMWLEMPFLAPLLKLGGLAPILIEMRPDRPMVVLQKPFPDTAVLLTIAPRVENDDSD